MWAQAGRNRSRREAGCELINTNSVGLDDDGQFLLLRSPRADSILRCVAASPSRTEEATRPACGYEIVHGADALPRLDVAIDGADQVGPVGLADEGRRRCPAADTRRPSAAAAQPVHRDRLLGQARRIDLAAGSAQASSSTAVASARSARQGDVSRRSAQPRRRHDRRLHGRTSTTPATSRATLRDGWRRRARDHRPRWSRTSSSRRREQVRSAACVSPWTFPSRRRRRRPARSPRDPSGRMVVVAGPEATASTLSSPVTSRRIPGAVGGGECRVHAGRAPVRARDGPAARWMTSRTGSPGTSEAVSTVRPEAEVHEVEALPASAARRRLRPLAESSLLDRHRLGVSCAGGRRQASLEGASGCGRVARRARPARPPGRNGRLLPGHLAERGRRTSPTASARR